MPRFTQDAYEDYLRQERMREMSFGGYPGYPPGVSDRDPHFDLPSTGDRDQNARAARREAQRQRQEDQEPKQPEKPMTQTQPIPIDPEGQLPSVNFGGGPQLPNRPALRIDSGTGDWSKKPGTWNYCNVPIENVTMLIADAVQVRSLFLRDYNTDPKAPLICASWNGVDAFGHGERSDDPAKLRVRDCTQCPSGQWRQSPAGKNVCLCPPSWLMFGMLIHKDSDVWMPFVWLASGLNARPAGKAWDDVRSMSATTIRRAAGSGQPVALKPPWCFAMRTTLVKNLGANGYTCNFGAPDELPHPDKQFVAKFFVEQGVRMWKLEKGYQESRAKEIGAQAPQGAQSPRGSGSEPAAGEDYGQVPF